MPKNMPAASVGDLIAGRRTIYRFKPDLTPPREKILEAVNAARWAPNHHLTEPWHFYLIGPATARAIAELNAELVKQRKDEAAAQAKLERWLKIPGWLALTCDRSEDTVRAMEDYAACCCAAQNLMLYLWSEGIGVKWNTGDLIHHPQFYDLLWVDPDLERAIGIFWYGYAEAIPTAARKRVDQFLVELP